MDYVDKVLDGNVEYDIRDPNLTLSYLHYFVDGENVQCFAKPYYINTNGVWAAPSYTHLLIPVSNVSSVYIAANNATTYAFLTNDTVTVSSTPSYATGSGRTVLSASASVNLTVPTDAQYLYLHYIVNSVEYTPAQLRLDNVDFFKTVPQLLAEIINETT